MEGCWKVLKLLLGNKGPDCKIIMSLEHKSPLEDRLKSRHNGKDDFFKELWIATDFENKKKYLITQRLFNDSNLASKEAELKRKRKAMKNEYFVNLVDYTYEVKKNLCSTNYFVRSFYEFPQKSLKKEIVERRKKSKTMKFTNEEMTHLFYNIVLAGKELQKNEQHHGDISPFCIFHTNEGKFKLAPHPLEHLSSLKVQQEKSVKSEPLYVSSQMLYAVKKRKSKAELNHYKSDTFSFGLVLLEAGLLKPITGIYTGSTINETALKQYIKEFETIYCDNPLLFSSLQTMLEIKEEDRADFNGLTEVIPSYESICDYFYNVQHGIQPDDEDFEDDDFQQDPNDPNYQGFDDGHGQYDEHGNPMPFNGHPEYNGPDMQQQFGGQGYNQADDYNQMFDQNLEHPINAQNQGFGGPMQPQFNNKMGGNPNQNPNNYQGQGQGQYGQDQYDDRYNNIPQYGNGPNDGYDNGQYGNNPNDGYDNGQYGNNPNYDNGQNNMQPQFNKKMGGNPNQNPNNNNQGRPGSQYGNNQYNNNNNNNNQNDQYDNNQYDNNQYDNNQYDNNQNDNNQNDNNQNDHYDNNQNDNNQNDHYDNNQYDNGNNQYDNQNEQMGFNQQRVQPQVHAKTTAPVQGSYQAPAPVQQNYTNPPPVQNTYTQQATEDPYGKTNDEIEDFFGGNITKAQPIYNQPKSESGYTYGQSTAISNTPSTYQQSSYTNSVYNPSMSNNNSYQGNPQTNANPPSYSYQPTHTPVTVQAPAQSYQPTTTYNPAPQMSSGEGEIVVRNGKQYRQIKETKQEVVNGQSVTKTIIRLTPV